MNKLALIYHCHPINDGLHHLAVFLERSYQSNIDFYIACVDFDPPKQRQQNLQFFSVPNDSHDYGGFSRIILSDINFDSYDHIGFFNSSCLGPFSSTNESQHWTQKFIDRLTGDTGICGSTINCLSSESPHWDYLANHLDCNRTYYHVQTYAFILKNVALKTLMEASFFKFPTNWSKTDTVINYELKLSEILLQNNFNLSCLINEYNDIDFRFRSTDTIKLEKIGDPCFLGAINGRSIQQDEVLFIKPARGFSNII